MLTFLVGASFLNRGHFDLFYHWVALIMVFGHIAMAEMRSESTEPVPTGVREGIRSEPRVGFGARPPRGPERSAFPVNV